MNELRTPKQSVCIHNLDLDDTVIVNEDRKDISTYWSSEPHLKEQAGTGPSRRHIYGSKIPKGSQIVKVLVNSGPFYENNFF